MGDWFKDTTKFVDRLLRGQMRDSRRAAVAEATLPGLLDEGEPGVVGDYGLVELAPYGRGPRAPAGQKQAEERVFRRGNPAVLDTRLTEEYTREQAVNDMIRARSGALEENVMYDRMGRRNFPTAVETGFLKDAREVQSDVNALDMEVYKTFVEEEGGRPKAVDPSIDLRRPIPMEYDADSVMRDDDALLRLMIMGKALKLSDEDRKRLAAMKKLVE